MKYKKNLQCLIILIAFIGMLFTSQLTAADESATSDSEVQSTQAEIKESTSDSTSSKILPRNLKSSRRDKDDDEDDDEDDDDDDDDKISPC